MVPDRITHGKAHEPSVKQVDGHVTDDSEIFWSMAFAYTAVIFSESDVQAPVQAVFDAPVLSDGFGDGSGVVAEAGDEVGCFHRGLLR